MTQTSEQESGQSSLWLYNPWADLILGCGAWTVPLLLLTYLSASRELAWGVAFYALAVVFNYPHYTATIYRAYHTREDFRKYRIFTVHITALVILTGLLAHFSFAVLPWLITIYLTWSPWHYSGQNYGLFMMFLRRAGAQPTTIQRRALYSAFLLSYGFLFLTLHTGTSGDPLFLSLAIPAKLSFILRAVFGIGFVATSSFGLIAVAKKIGVKAMTPSLTLLTSQTLWFIAPSLLALIAGLQIPQNRYSTGVLAIMHSVQYLWITTFYARKEAAAKRLSGWKPLAYFAVLVVGGIALFIPGPWLASYVFHYDYSASFLIFTALVNIHHFILDGAIWKLRDGRIASLLLNSKQEIAYVTRNARDRATSGLEWIEGATLPARGLRYSLVFLLAALAALDVVRYGLAVDQTNVKRLYDAAQLNPYDSTVTLRLARQEIQAGNDQQALINLEHAVAVNPAFPAARNELLRLLISEKRFSEAHELSFALLEKSPRDVELLTNNGVLASKLGLSLEAIDSWQRALVHDPKQVTLHLYLANQYESIGRCSEAIPHYVFFLDNMAKISRPTDIPADRVIPIILQLAECQVKAGQQDNAVKSYDLARMIALKANALNYASVAAGNEADLLGKLGRTADAVRLFQATLKLDAALTDRQGEATDWYNFALLLHSDHQDELAYASLLKANDLLEASPASQHKELVHNQLENLERSLGQRAADVRHHAGQIRDHALSLTT
jgi:tetratricopeptide (TPR) repeat protein